jgi:CRP/FNR family cyclic AMP-dependent transcriptional regulator
LDVAHLLPLVLRAGYGPAVIQNHDFLKDIKLLQGLDDEERTALAALMEDVTFTDGQQIFKEDDVGGIFYVLRSGWIELSIEDEDNKKVVIDRLGPGEVFGELSLLDGGTRTATATALTEVQAVSLKRPEFLDFLRRRPDASLDLLSALAKRLRQADALLKARVENPNLIIEEQATWPQRIADGVASFGGSWAFILTFAGITAGWITINSILGEPLDPFPFILLNLALSTLAALQGPVIMMSQNRQDAKDRIRAEADFHVNVKAEAEILELHDKLDRLRLELNLKLESLTRRLPRA